ncbi:class I SAM-dependent methyltransferase [[Clostridium] scindens]|uniref:class I SAM-dependent methyltransferase n=1 Tax=Clostridium scindens (strain JCM 10418 / VPI 12708) TaxID=29347 RepID=UPI0034A43966
MSFFQNTCRPQGIGGKIMVHMMNTGHSSMAEWGFAHIKIQSEDVCLDIGCGGGANIRKLLEKSPYGRVVGIDYSEISVEKSRKINKAGIESKRCEILQGDVMKLPFRDKTFDVITAFETIYFWPDISEAFKKVYKILKIGGTFMICNESNGENPKDEKWTKIIQGMKIYNSEQIEKSLENAGFRDVKVDKTKKGWICVVVKKL